MAFYGGPFTGGGRLHEMVSLVDVAPTLLDACGLEVPEDMQGRYVMPLLHGNPSDAEWPEEVFVQISETQVGRAVRTKRWKYSVEAFDKHPTKDSCGGEYTETFLYDLEHDPYELDNLITSKAHEEVCHIMACRLKKCMVQAGEKEPVIHSVPKEVMGQRRVFPGEEWR